MTLTDLYQQLFGKAHIQDGTVIEMAEHGRAGGISTGQGYKFIRGVEEETLIDEPTSSLMYVGKAKVGSIETDPAWQIKQILATGTITAIKYINGSDSYSFVWESRASLSYS